MSMITKEKKIGVLLVNLGSPEAPTARALRPYLRQFLWDPRIVEMPRLKWWLILNLFVLTTRPSRSAALYQKIWTDQGSPLVVSSRRLKDGVARNLALEFGDRVEVALGMRYGRPSITEALSSLRADGCSRLICLPLFPQYSGTTTGSVCDALADELKTWRRVPSIRTINDYCDDPGYIGAIAASIRSFWERHGEAEKLLVSFHSIPVSYAEAGDPYVKHCERTYDRLKSALDLPDDRCLIAFQSRFGKDPWVGPATDQTVRELAQSGVKRLDVVCPGFAVDCLETTDEIGREAKERFEENGDQKLRLIPCLNDDPEHAAVISRLIVKNFENWEK